MQESEGNEDMEVDQEEDDVVFIPDEEEFMIEEEDLIEGEEEEAAAEDQREIKEDSLYTISNHAGQPVYVIGVNHKETSLISGGGDDQSFLYKLEDGMSSMLMGKFGDSVSVVGFSCDDELAAVGAMDGVIQIFHLSQRKSALSLEGPSSEIEWLSWHPLHPVLVAGFADGTIWMWNLSGGVTSLLGVFTGHNDSVTCGRFTPNGRRIVSASIDGTLKLWDPNNFSCVHTFSGEHQYHSSEGIVSIAFKQPEQGGLLVATGGAADGLVCLVKVENRKILSRLKHADEAGVSVECLAFCENKQLNWLCSGGSDGRVVVWDLAVQAKRCVLPHDQAVVRLCFESDTVHLFTACADSLVRKFDVRSNKWEKTYSGHRDAILDMVLLQKGRKIITASEDGTCRVFDL